MRGRLKPTNFPSAAKRARIVWKWFCLKAEEWPRWPLKDASDFEFLLVMFYIPKSCFEWMISEKFAVCMGWDSMLFLLSGHGWRVPQHPAGDAAIGRPVNSSHPHRSISDMMAVLGSTVGKSEASIPRSKLLVTLSRTRQRPSQRSSVVRGWGCLTTSKGPSGAWNQPALCLPSCVPRSRCAHLEDRLPFSSLHTGTTLTSFSCREHTFPPF